MNILQERKSYSETKIAELKSRIEKLSSIKEYPGLTIVCAGSFARLEGSEYSDIDIFFFCNTPKKEISCPRTKELKIFGELIHLIEELDYPPFSADSKFLEIIHTDEIQYTLGSSLDDHKNHFTARMLLLLESKCLYNHDNYNEAIKTLVSWYYKDFPTHKEVFYPTFLINDIMRYWKTLLLNYENKRSLNDGANSGYDITKEKIKHKIKNFKLKFSRATTCFATIAIIGSIDEVIKEEKLIKIIEKTPMQRLEEIKEIRPEVCKEIDELLDLYSWFIAMTGKSSDDLEQEFSDEENRNEFFRKALHYGDKIFVLLNKVAKDKDDFIRRLVI